jgi:hypothetical protein
MAPQIAHTHHRWQGKLALGLWGTLGLMLSRYTIRFVYHLYRELGTRSTETPTQEHGVLAMMKAPLRPGTRPVGAA